VPKIPGHVENVAADKADPAIPSQSLQLSVKDVESLSIDMAVNRDDNAGGKDPPEQAISIIGVRQRRRC